MAVANHTYEEKTDEQQAITEMVRKFADNVGDPYKVLAPVSHEAHGSGTTW